MAEERTLHEAKLAKMEAEMNLVFQQKVAEKESKLKQSEEELYARHREMKEALERQRLELEEKKKRIESGRPLTPENKVSFPSLGRYCRIVVAYAPSVCRRRRGTGSCALRNEKDRDWVIFLFFLFLAFLPFHYASTLLCSLFLDSVVWPSSSVIGTILIDFGSRPLLDCYGLSPPLFLYVTNTFRPRFVCPLIPISLLLLCDILLVVLWSFFLSCAGP